MSANLDKSLDDLVGNRRQNARRRAGPRRAAKKASVGGVKKSTKAAPKAAHPAPVTPIASSKILVSGLVCFYPSPSRHLIMFTANIFSLPTSPRAMSRYVDKKALTLAFIAFSSLESLAAQTISIHSANSLFLFSSIHGTDKLLLPRTYSWHCARQVVGLLSQYGEGDIARVDFTWNSACFVL